MNEPDEKASRPITLYASRVTYPADLDHLHTERVTTLDVEMSMECVAELLRLLRERSEKNLPGAIRVRLFGRLVIE